MTLERIEFITTSENDVPKGFEFPVVLGTGGFFTRANGARAITAGIKQLLLTSPGDRVMRPGYGAGLRDFVFDLDDPETRNAIKSRVINAITHSEPRSFIKSIEVESDYRWGQQDYNRLLIKLRLGIIGDSVHDHVMELIL